MVHVTLQQTCLLGSAAGRQGPGLQQGAGEKEPERRWEGRAPAAPRWVLWAVGTVLLRLQGPQHLVLQGLT